MSITFMAHIVTGRSPAVIVRKQHHPASSLRLTGTGSAGDDARFVGEDGELGPVAGA
jgi:hypothetical protein